jgi:hypothetical protein
METTIEKVECIDCQADIDIDDALELSDGSMVCADCADESYTSCAECGDLTENDEITCIRDKFYCESCRNDAFTSCESCGDYVQNDYAYRSSQDDEYFCSDCYCERYCTCDGCGAELYADGEYTNYRDDGVFCDSCDEPDDNGREFAPPFKQFTGKTHIRIKRRYGVEIESNNGAEYTDDVQNDTVFGSCEDGSLDSGGMEFYSPIMDGDNSLSEIEKLCNIGLTVNKSCGLHLHIEPSGYNWRDLRKLVVFCKILEPTLMELVSQSRRGNQFSRAIDVSLDSVLYADSKTEFIERYYALQKDYIKSYSKIHKRKSITSGKYQLDIGEYCQSSKRYEWLNLNTYFYRGTVEIRLHQGTTNYQKIKNWILLWQFIFDWINKNTLEDCYNMNDAKFWNILPQDISEFYQQRIKKLNP